MNEHSVCFIFSTSLSFFDQITMNKNEIASQAMRQRILSTTLEIVGNEGLAALTATKLGKKAGISKGALYHHFDNLDAVKHAAVDELISMFLAVAEPANFDDFESYLEVTGDTLYLTMKCEPYAMKAMYSFTAQALFDDQFRESIQRFSQHGLAEYTRAIDYFYQGKIPQHQIDTAIRVVDAFFLGVGLQSYLLQGEDKFRQNWALFSQMLLKQLGEK
ncbi:TetR/AcrR family transcriptional regulator [Salinivibrio proteolyticus]|uniref:TetR/AcrR family transcriptional regulator n=1 Tax=Salinivibrio proteolyticus TaxID=334715 RepID=UPI00105460A1|nr:TetR/AcrR family transcriptional regulator [Salinivibrio proteolyticus]